MAAGIKEEEKILEWLLTICIAQTWELKLYVDLKTSAKELASLRLVGSLSNKHNFVQPRDWVPSTPPQASQDTLCHHTPLDIHSGTPF